MIALDEGISDLNYESGTALKKRVKRSVIEVGDAHCLCSWRDSAQIDKNVEHAFLPGHHPSTLK